MHVENYKPFFKKHLIYFTSFGDRTKLFKLIDLNLANSYNREQIQQTRVTTMFLFKAMFIKQHTIEVHSYYHVTIQINVH